MIHTYFFAACLSILMFTGKLDSGSGAYNAHECLDEGLNIVLIDCLYGSQEASAAEEVTVTNNATCVQKVTDYNDVNVSEVYIQPTKSVVFPSRSGASFRYIQSVGI